MATTNNSSAAAPAKPKGRSGRGHYGGFITPDEFNANLQGYAGQLTYIRMWRSDGDIRKALRMVINPIVAATWEVAPHGGKDAEEQDIEIADFVQWALFESMKPRLQSHLDVALRVAGRGGFAPFEMYWNPVEYQGKTRIVPKSLGLRLPHTIDQYRQDGDELTAIHQQPALGPAVWLPAEDLVYYRFGAEGDNWEGESLLRPAYKHWKYKEQLELVDAIGHERFAVGIPVGYLPEGASDEAADKMEEFLQGIRANESGYLVIPGPKQGAGASDGTGYLVEILTPKSGGEGARSIWESIKGHSDKIAASVIEEFMRLGQQGVGARATADVQQDPFLTYCEVLAQTVVEDAINEQLIPRLVSLNFDTDRYPKLRASLIDSTSLEQLATFVSTLSSAGALHPDQELEDFLRSRADLPPADPEAIRQREEDEQTARDALAAGAQEEEPPKPGAKPKPVPGKEEPAKKELARAREPRWWEQAMELERIENAISTARDRFQAAAAEHVHALAADLAARKALPASVQPPVELVDALADELRALYVTGRMTVADELDAQARAPIGLAKVLAAGDEPEGLIARARFAAEVIVGSVLHTIRRATFGRGADQAAKQRAAEQAAAGALRSEAQQHAAAALNMGRQDEAEDRADIIKGARYTSILDPNRCPECNVADDDVLRPLTDPVRLRHRPPNPDCHGGDRCRCLEFYELVDEQAAALTRYELGYNPNQPRDPGGEGGGRWVKRPGPSGLKIDVDAAFREHYDTIRSQLRSKFRHDVPEDFIDEAMTHAFTQLMEKPPAESDEHEGVGAWLHKVAENKVLNLLRQRKTRRKKESGSLDEPTPSGTPRVELLEADQDSVEDVVIDREEIAELRALIEDFPEREKLALELQGYGYSYAKIAVLTGWSKRTVEKQLMKGKRRLDAVKAEREAKRQQGGES